MISKWTRDIYKTTLHRVINTSGKGRYSVPFFFDGALDSVIDCLPECENGPGGESKPVTVEGHMLRKFAESVAGHVVTSHTCVALGEFRHFGVRNKKKVSSLI